MPMSTEKITFKIEKCSTPSDTFLSIVREIENEEMESEIKLKSSLSNHSTRSEKENDKTRKLVHFSESTNNLVDSK